MSETPGVSRQPQTAGGALGERKRRNNGPQILTFALKKRPRATRASVPKVRTGCNTCKKRHVKCDESKPFCQRCLKWQGFCDGYETPSSIILSVKTEAAAAVESSRTTKQLSNEDLVYAFNCLARKEDRRLLPEINDQIFGDEFEALYFNAYNAFRNQAGGGFFDNDLWAQTIPQLCREHPAIRYASMACGAIGTAVSGSLKSMTPAELAANGPHYSKALAYYGRAIREVRVAHSNTCSLRAAIVSCLLFVCFESLHGDRKAAFSHINNGQLMMDELLRKSDKEKGHSILGAETLERDALHIFQRLILQSWSCGVLRPKGPKRQRAVDIAEHDIPAHRAAKPWCCRGGSSTKCVMDNMPSSFQSLDDAHQWWDVTQHYVMHNSTIVFRVTHLGLTEDLVAECQSRVKEHMDRIEAISKGDQLPDLNGWQHFKDCMEEWHSRFEPLFSAARQGRREDPRSYLQAIYLRVQYLTMYTCVYGPLSCDFDTIKRLTPTFREIVKLSAILLGHQAQQRKHSQNRDVFTMDIGPTWALFLAGTRCRDCEVREEAVRLLQIYPRRDGLWDSRMFYALAVRNRGLELSNAEEGTEEEQWRRLQYRTAIIDEQGQLVARAIGRNPFTGKWETGEDSHFRQYLKV